MMLFFLFVLAALVLLSLVSGGYVFLVGCVRRKELPWFVEEELQKTSYGKYYKHIIAADQWLTDHSAEDVSIISDDGLQLHALWIPAKDPKGTILLAHGYRSTKLVDFGMVYDFYHEHGMNILVPDQRSHGKSQGRFITFGVKESKDMLRWIEYHNRRFGRHQMILSGLSMGASTVLYLADEPLPDNVKGIIADCGFTSPKDILSSVFTNVTHLPAVPTIWATELFARLFAGFSLTEKDSRKTLAKNRLPILMVHGKEDGFVPCSMTEEGFAACTGPKQLLLVDGADHGVSFIVDKPRYTSMVTEFLKNNLEGFR